MISKILQLAKLRQYKGGDVVEFMQTQFRQNMVAIEQAFRLLASPPNFLSCQLSSLTVNNGQEEFFEFAYYVRTTNQNQTGKGGYLTKAKGNYLLTVNLTGCYVDGTGSRNAYFRLYKGGKELTAAPILLTNAAAVFNLSFTWIIELQLEAEDVLTFSVSNSGSIPGDVTVSYGYLKIEQLTQG